MAYPTTFGTIPDQQLLQEAPLPIYATTANLQADVSVFPVGTVAVTLAPFAMYIATQTAPTDSQYVTSTSSPQFAAGGGVVTYWKQIAGVQRVTQTFTLTQLQALTSGTAFSCLPVLPTGAKLLAFDVVVNQALAGNTSDTITVNGTGDAVGSIVASASVFTGGSPVIGMTGANPYAQRSAQQIQAVITGGSALSGLTAGNLTFNAYIAPTL